MAVADTIRVEFVWQMGGVDYAANVLHYTTGVSTTLVQAHVDAMASDIATEFTASGLRSRYGTGQELDRILVRDLRTDGNLVLTGTIALAGSSATNPLPAQTCVVSTLRTTDGSRRGRGRIFWPGGHSNTTGAAGELGSATQTDYNDFMTAILSLSAGALGSVVLGVYSRADGVTRTVTSFNTDNVFDVQTRRRDLSIV